MAYKYEVEQKANAVKVRVLVAVYVMFVVSSILIGIAVRLQQLQTIRTTNPGAATAGNPAAAAVSTASDPTYAVRELMALAYCDVIDANGNSTGQTLPLAARFHFKQIQRDVGQTNSNPQYLQNMCSSASGPACNWRTINDPQGRCRNGQTVGQCNPTNFNACDDGAVPGALFYSQTDIDTTATNYIATWPRNPLGPLIYDNNEVDVFLNENSGDLAGDTITRGGVTYTINKNSLQAVDTSSLFPIYNWRCNNDVCTGNGACQNGSLQYSPNLCSFNSTTRQFTCPTNKYTRYTQLTDNKTFYYTLSNAAGPVAGQPNWVKTGYAYETLANNSYDNALPGANDNAIAFRGNVVKFKYSCRSSTVITETPTPTPLISARKTGPVCVERVSPNNHATFTVTVTNNGENATVINSVEDALPQGFTYFANSTIIGGTPVTDAYVTTVNSGTSQKVTFAPPAGQSPWSLASGQTLTVVFTTVASANAVTGINTNRVVVTPENGNAIDDISYQFEVSQTCNPITGVLDQPIVVLALSGVLILGGIYLLYAPSGSKVMQLFGVVGKRVEARVIETGKKLEDRASIKKQFEKRVQKKIKK